MYGKRRKLRGSTSRLLGLGAVCVLAATTPATPLVAQTSTFVQGTTFNSDPLNTYTTFGQYMLGISLSWTFTDGSFDSAAFGQVIGLGFDLEAGVKKNGFMLSLGWNSDTFTDTWYARNNTGKSIASIRFNGQPGKVVFDCGWTPSGCATQGDPSMMIGTETSARGRTFTWVNADSYNGPIVGEYANMVGLSGAPPVGDIFEQFTMNFAAGFDNNSFFGFKLDTDNTSGLIAERVLPPPVTAVPEPSSVALVAVGLLALLSLQRMRGHSPSL